MEDPPIVRVFHIVLAEGVERGYCEDLKGGRRVALSEKSPQEVPWALVWTGSSLPRFRCESGEYDFPPLDEVSANHWKSLDPLTIGQALAVEVALVGSPVGPVGFEVHFGDVALRSIAPRIKLETSWSQYLSWRAGDIEELTLFMGCAIQAPPQWAPLACLQGIVASEQAIAARSQLPWVPLELRELAATGRTLVNPEK